MKTASFFSGLALSLVVVTIGAIRSGDSERCFYAGLGAATAAIAAGTAAVDSRRQA